MGMVEYFFAASISCFSLEDETAEVMDSWRAGVQLAAKGRAEQAVVGDGRSRIKTDICSVLEDDGHAGLEYHRRVADAFFVQVLAITILPLPPGVLIQQRSELVQSGVLHELLVVGLADLQMMNEGVRGGEDNGEEG